MESAPDIADRTGRAVSQSMPQSGSPDARLGPSRAERRLTFVTAMRHGATITEASRAAGINRNTGTAWARRVKEQNDLTPERGSVLTKMQAAQGLTELAVSPDTDPRDKIAAIKSAADLLGYNAPTRSEVTHRVVPVSVVAWLDSEDRIDAIDVEITPALAP